ncbi:MAG: MerR family transcriptional regulator [Solirubrobacterales bacterium]|nr:MerR family transcriptional regulator [Solirubrobacterales bacterium]
MTVTTNDEQTPRPVPIGVLAKATGLTVRSLHHYDAIGLLVPDERSYSGRRLYSEQNVRRLYRIVALRRVGLSLEEIRTVLDRETDLVDAVRRHLSLVEQSLEAQRRLRSTLAGMLNLLERQRDPTVDQFIQAIEETNMIEKYYTPEQREQLARRREELGEDRIREAEREWAELIEAVRGEQAAGTPPDAPRMRALARHWRRLVEQFTGGDEGIRRSLATMYREEGAKTASRGMVDPELMRYVGEALDA